MATDAETLMFGPFRLHPVQGLNDGGREIRVTPKSLAVLCALAKRPGELVTKDELFDAAWPTRTVSDSTLSSCIRELRQVLGDDARQPRFIETVHRRGFRFLPHCSGTAETDKRTLSDADVNTEFDREIAELDAELDRSRNGPGAIVALRGNDDSGKRALIDAFVERVARNASWQLGRGACDESAGAGDPCRPLLDALTALCLQSGGARVASLLRMHAPSWLSELTKVLQPGELAAQRIRTAGVTTTRLRAELDAALTAIADTQPLLLVLEDLQWSDAHTLGWLTGPDRPFTAPIVVLVTHDAVDDIDIRPSLLLELEDRSDNGLRSAWRDDVERSVLQAAAVIGPQFSGKDVAQALDLTLDIAEETLLNLVTHGDIVFVPDPAQVREHGVGRQYRFSSRALRAQMLKSLDVLQGRRLQRRIARSTAHSLGAFAVDRSPELAIRYEKAYEIEEAVACAYDAALLCRRRGAHVIAHDHLRRGLALLAGLAESDDKIAWDALLHAAAGGELVASRGLGDAEIDQCFERVLDIAADMRASQRSFDILWRCWVYFFNRGPLAKAHDLASRLFDIARALDSPTLELGAHHAFWCTALMLGDVRGVLRNIEDGISLCGAGLDGATAMTNGCTFHDAHESTHHAAVCAGCCGAWAESLAGRCGDAKQSADVSITHARDFGQPFSLAMALTQSAGALAAGGDAVNTRRYASEGAAVAKDHGFLVFEAWAKVYEGWATARLGDQDTGLQQMYRGLAVFRGTDFWLFRPFQLALAAELELSCGMHDAAASSLEEAFAVAERAGDRLAAAQLHWLKGELALATATGTSDHDCATRSLKTALDIALASGAERIRTKAAESLERCGIVGHRHREPHAREVSAVTSLDVRRPGRDA